MVAKDANDHPLHDLAATLAREAVEDVGRCIHKIWQGEGSAADVVSCASQYFVHPARSGLLDGLVKNWRGRNGAKVAAASNQSAALKRAKEHQHGGHHDEHRHLPQQFEQMWAFTGQHFEHLFGREDLTGEFDAGDFA